MTTENDTDGINIIRNRIFFIFKEDLMFEISIFYEIKLFSVHRWKDEQEGFLDSDYSFSDSSKFPHIDNEGCLV